MGSIDQTPANGGLYSVPFWINGEEVHPAKSFDVTAPATLKVVHKCGSATSAEVDAAVDAASKAFVSWRKSLPKTRRDIFLKAAEIMERRREELVGYMKAETAATEPWANFNVNVAKDLMIDVAGRIASLEGTFPTTEDADTAALILREPFGVVLAIAPWNAPYILSARSVIFPIAAGNTAILKASELSPRVMWAICSVFHEAGLPAGVLNMIVHEPASAAKITADLIAHEAVKKINFTGSTMVGRIIGRLAGEHLKPVLLELGGKAPAIVWEDADLDVAAKWCAIGAFFNSGQVCMSTERILCHKAVRAAFEEKFRATIDAIFGNGQDAPVLIHAPSAEKNRKLVRDAVSKGASIVYGDVEAQEATATRMRPVVVAGVKEEMDIYRTESFGPTVSLFEIESEDEALRIANDTEYGLTAAVFTEDLRRGLRFAREIETGAVHINSMTIHDESALPHGGAKSSGYGRFNAQALHEWVRTKTVTFKY